MSYLRTAALCTLVLLAGLAPRSPGQGWISVNPQPSGPSVSNLVELYGQGCAGNDGVVPILHTNSNPVIGNATFALVGDPLPEGTSAAYLLFASNHSFVPLGAGCNLLLETSTLQFLPMPISDGRAELAVPLPLVQALVGTDIYLQLGVSAPSPSGIALSPGVRVEFSEPQSEFGTIALLSGTSGDLTPTYHHRAGQDVEAALPASLAIEDIQLAGLDTDRALTRDAGQTRIELDTEDPTAPAIQLQNLGRLYRYQDNQTGERGFFVARSAAALMTPVMSSELGTGDDYSPMVGVHPSGDLLAAHVGNPTGDSIFLASLTDIPLAGSSLRVDISPSASMTVDPATLLFVGESVIAIGTLHATNQQVLLSAPADGTQALTPVTLPALGSGAPAQTLGPDLLHGGDKVAFVARDSIQSDVFVFDPATSTMLNVTQFSFPVTVDPLAAPGQPRRGAMKGDGEVLFFTADDGGGRNGYLAGTDGGDAGTLLGREFTGDDHFHPGLDEIIEPTFGGDDLFVFIGADTGSLDLYQFHLLGDDTNPGADPSNVTQTGGSIAPPFFPGGTMNVVTSFRNPAGTVLYVVQEHPGGLRDLIAVDFTVRPNAGPVTNITGSGFTTAPSQQFVELESLTFFRTPETGTGFTSCAVMVTRTPGTPSTTANELTVWDAANPASLPPQNLGSAVAYHDIVFPLDGKTFGCVESDVGANAPLSQVGTSDRIIRYDLATGTTSTVATLDGKVGRGSLRYTDSEGNGMFFFKSTLTTTNSTIRTLESLSTVTGNTRTITDIPEKAVTAGSSVNSHISFGCEFTGDVDVTSFGVGRHSYMEVTINAPNPSTGIISVKIEGDGPSFADGTRTKLVLCRTGTTRFDINANAKPGCFHVRLHNQVLRNRIRVIKPVATFRNAGTFSSDNRFPAKPDCGALNSDCTLGEGRNFYGSRLSSIVNTMEIRYTLTPKDGCRSVFDIKRTKSVREYANGLLKGSPRIGNSDPDNRDEDLTPSGAGNIYSIGVPGFVLNHSAGVVGDTREYHGHFTEWLTVRNKRRFEVCSADLLWESHLFVKRSLLFGNLLVWILDNDKSDISPGHDISLASQH